MAISYGVSSGDGKATGKTYERIAVADNTGVVAQNILKYTRTEVTTETVTSTFGAPLIGADEVLSASITWSVDEAIVEAAASGTVPRLVRLYNPKAEATATILASTFTAATFSLDSITFDVVSAEISETLGDVKKVTLRGIAYGNNAQTLTTGTASSGTNKAEKRFSNTDFVRTTATTFSFGAS
jgi:hypothetical protein